MQVKSITECSNSVILLTIIMLPFVIKIFVLSIFEWPFYTGSTVPDSSVFVRSSEYISEYVTKYVILL